MHEFPNMNSKSEYFWLQVDFFFPLCFFFSVFSWLVRPLHFVSLTRVSTLSSTFLTQLLSPSLCSHRPKKPSQKRVFNKKSPYGSSSLRFVDICHFISPLFVWLGFGRIFYSFCMMDQKLGTMVSCMMVRPLLQHEIGFDSWFLAFLIGPAEQLRKMFDPVRVYASAIYLGCAVLALICAILIHSKILTLLSMICEICALIWYSLSYIPFARRMVSDVMIRLFDTEI